MIQSDHEENIEQPREGARRISDRSRPDGEGRGTGGWSRRTRAGQTQWGTLAGVRGGKGTLVESGSNLEVT